MTYHGYRAWAQVSSGGRRCGELNCGHRHHTIAAAKRCLDDQRWLRGFVPIVSDLQVLIKTPAGRSWVRLLPADLKALIGGDAP